MDRETTEPTATPDGAEGATIAPDVVIALDYDRHVNFAMQQNAVPVIKRLDIENRGETTLTDLTISVTADPDFAPPWQVRVESLAPGDRFVREDLDLGLSPGYLAGLEERLRGRLTVEVSTDRPIATHAVDCDLLAYNEWAGMQSLPEILAAFVQPNHRSLAPILRRTADLLAEQPGSSGISGYQSRSARYVQAQVAALYQALQEVEIAYINPPASFEQSGQKIRLADTLLTDRLGTCLDLTVLVAACLEQMGLHAVIVLLRGHCFPGVWLTESDFPYATVDDVVTVDKRRDLDEMLVFESTLIAGTDAAPFAQAVASGAKQLADRERFQLAIDLHRARVSQIRPMASRVAAADAQLESAPSPATPTARLPDPERDDGPAAEPAEETAETRLDRWRRRLLDLSMHNRMLNFRATSKVARLVTHDLGELEDAVASERVLKVLPKPRNSARPTRVVPAWPRRARVTTR